MSCRQQLAPPLRDATKMSPRISICQSPSCPPIPCPGLQRAATVRREKVQVPIGEQINLFAVVLWWECRIASTSTWGPFWTPVPRPRQAVAAAAS